ncbi:hypothetical protein AXF42_Ash014163 [Apostasia shenzhenica]|uniref:AT5G11810-like protein n=1 Tax=Apostasia shenzhenica TaxID=1088818 RepID=A0A2I0A143_9ASPA|nr:hypothetical protein AXF42_Ash014163 [Apostasia shenzhenica]
MADKPSRALVIYGDGIAPLVLSSHGNLHSFASRAACGFLSLRASHPSETEDERVTRDLSQLLDAYDFYLSEKNDATEANADLCSISKRFMGLRAAMVTSSPCVESFGRKLGFSILHYNELLKHHNSHSETSQEVPDNSAIVSEWLRLLGFLESNVLDNYDFDLLFLHIHSSEKLKEKKCIVASDIDVDRLNDLVGEIMGKANPRSAISSRLHFSIVLSYGSFSKDQKLYSLISSPLTQMNSDLSLLRPKQSYCIKGGHMLNDIRHHHPMLIAQLQEGVTRRDMAKAFSFEEFKENGANLAILSDRFLHEIAFKLWKAPKYGA